MTAAEIAHALGCARGEGAGWRCRCPLGAEHMHGDADPSLSLVERDGKILVHCQTRHAQEQDRVIAALKERRLWPTANGNGARPRADGVHAKADDGEDWEAIVPVPADAPPDPPEKLRFKSCSPNEGYLYLDLTGRRTLGFTFRFDYPGSGKDVIPRTFCRNRKTGARAWRWKAFPKPRPLYGQELLAVRPEAVVVWTEGEKCREALQGALDAAGNTDFIVVASPGGAPAAKFADYSPLASRRTVWMPDHDAEGFDAVIHGARRTESLQLKTRGAITESARIVVPDAASPSGFDVADMLEQGMSVPKVLEHIAARGVGLDEFERIARERFVQKQSPADTIRAEVARLALLDGPGYLAERRAVAKALGIPITDLDKLIERARRAPEAAAREPLAPPAPEAWSEPVEAGALLDDLSAFIKRFVIVEEHTLIALVLWVAFTHCFEIAETSVRLAILSPTKRCGKTRLLELLALLCLRPIAASNLSPSTVFRTIDAEHPTLLIDEADTFARDNDELRGLLNSGHTRATAYAIRNIKIGDDWMPKRFSTWSPVAIAAIGRLPETWIDRSIVVSMKRKLRSQSVERLTRRNAEARERAADLVSKLARFANDNLEALRTANPDPPALDSDRSVDNWEHLLAIADLAGGYWSVRARAAAVALSSQSNDTDDSFGVALLFDIRAIFDETRAERLASKAICESLAALEGRPWAEYGRARKAISQNQLARLLHSFGIAPATKRFETHLTAKGYERSDFTDTFIRYLRPDPSDLNRHSVTTIGAVGENELFGNVTGTARDGSKNAHFPHAEKDCDGVTARNPSNSDREDF